MNSFEFIALTVLPLLFLVVAFKPAVSAFSHFRWVTCPRCHSRADYASRHRGTKQYRCTGCGINIARRRGGPAEIVVEPDKGAADG